jgi:hypothetical protein
MSLVERSEDKSFGVVKFGDKSLGVVKYGVESRVVKVDIGLRGNGGLGGLYDMELGMNRGERGGVVLRENSVSSRTWFNQI